MLVYMGRTSKLKTGFVSEDYLPATSKSILTSVQVAIPQVGNTPIRQVGQRVLAGNYQEVVRPATVTLVWQTEHDEATRLFVKLLPYFQQRVGAVMIVNSTNLLPGAFSFLSGASYQIQGLEPAQYTLELTFLDCPSLYDPQLDPLQFVGVSAVESESQILITEDESHDELVTGKNASVSLRGDLRFAVNGYRSLRWSDATISESIQTIDADYIPTWDYDAFAELATAIESFNSNLGETGPRQYSLNRQAQLKAILPAATKLGW